jgi:hypothetical protein
VRAPTATSQELLHPVQRLLDVLHRVGVGKAHKALTVLAEGSAAQACHASLLQHHLGEFTRAHTQLLDVRKRVERPLRTLAPNAGQAVEPIHQDITATPELLHKALYCRERAFRERLQRSNLRKGRCATGAIRLQPCHHLGNVRGHEPVADAPARHGKGICE